jgi:enamine deaminase RidA (YjgF/YER057c/UK114 family)
MDRRNILADNPVEKKRGYMPGVCVNPSRLLFTAGLTGRNPDGSIVAGDMAAQTQRAMERLQRFYAKRGQIFPRSSNKCSISPTWTPTLPVDEPSVPPS